jgi:hypothetical protein
MFIFIPRKAASETQDMKPGVIDTSRPVSGKALSPDI